MKMKKLFLVSIVPLIMFSCGDVNENIEDVNESNTTIINQTVENESNLNNKGVGPYADTTIDLNKDIDQALVSAGEKIYNLKCITCHNMNSKLIGPPLSGILNRRSPEWVMNMILTPEIMLKEDPDAIKLLKEYNEIPMLPLGITDDEARQILEFLR